MEPNIKFKTNKKFYEEENETIEFLNKSPFSKNSNQIYKNSNSSKKIFLSKYE